MHWLPESIRMEIAMFLAARMIACERLKRTCRRVMKRLLKS
jgi:hypothetical protein